MDPVTDPGSPTQKPAYKTFEAWVAAAVVLMGQLVALGIIPSDSKVVALAGAAVSALAALGIIGARTLLKMNGNKTAAYVEAAKVTAGVIDKLPLAKP